MSILKPFSGVRPSKGLAAKVAAPPYDVLNGAEARLLAAGNEYSFLHINKPEIDLAEDVDVHATSVYEKGAENLQRFLAKGILCKDGSDSFYVYRQIMGKHQQTGLVALASLTEYEDNLIKKHEFTRPEKEDDRVSHMDHLNAQVGPVFLTYRSDNDINILMSQCTSTDPEYEFTSSDGVRHIFWVISNATLVKQLERGFQAVPCLYVADGHHRSAAALRIKKMRELANPKHRGDEPYNFFLVVVFPDEQMQILEYNRVVKDLNGLKSEEFLEKAATNFLVEKLPGAEQPKSNHVFTMYLSGQWYRLTCKEPLLAGIKSQHDPVEILDVTILQDKILSTILAIGDPRTDTRINFIGGIRGLDELQRKVDTGEYAVAFACFPCSIEDLLKIADANKVMPPKSTWFEPKLRSGLVIHSL